MMFGKYHFKELEEWPSICVMSVKKFCCINFIQCGLNKVKGVQGSMRTCVCAESDTVTLCNHRSKCKSTRAHQKSDPNRRDMRHLWRHKQSGRPNMHSAYMQVGCENLKPPVHKYPTMSVHWCCLLSCGYSAEHTNGTISYVAAF